MVQIGTINMMDFLIDVVFWDAVIMPVSIFL